MTENKPIMIDGVDVSGCKYFKTNYKEDCDVKIDNYCCETYVPCCSGFKYNCYFKRLSRKTQKCEILQQSENEAKEIIAELEAENEELKRCNDILKEHSRYYKNESKRYKKEIGKLKVSQKRAEQKLERIKEIADDYYNCDDVGHYVQDTAARHALEEVAQAMEDISQIIDEVE